MNRKGMVELESDEKKKQSWRTIRWRPITSLTSGSLNQGFLCEEDGGVEVDRGSGGAEEDISVHQIRFRR